ncbi:MAG: aminodeoxychorismate lyase [Pseudomonadota bacterium]
MLINGLPGDRISIQDRGLLYGDGVFRTMRVLDQRILHWPRHYDKLQRDCVALKLHCPDALLLRAEFQQLLDQHPAGVAKVIITRGTAQARGYAYHATASPTRILTVAPLPVFPADFGSRGVKVRVCDLALSHQPGLAGIKHLNRLENVLATAEWNDDNIAEGVLLDIAGNVVEGTRSNLFMVRNGELLTPDLSLCGVAGVQRERIIESATAHATVCTIGKFNLTELLAADEIFLVNSVIGLWPVRELQHRSWDRFPVAMQIQQRINHACD